MDRLDRYMKLLDHVDQEMFLQVFKWSSRSETDSNEFLNYNKPNLCRMKKPYSDHKFPIYNAWCMHSLWTYRGLEYILEIVHTDNIVYDP